MSEPSRRQFLRCGAASAVGAISATRSFATTMADRQNIAFIGCGGRAGSLWPSFRDHVRVAWACDPDASRATKFQKLTGANHVTGDLRRVLDDKSVTAVVIATPDHWHAPAAILACEAGKHVYVEKPQSHNLLESRWLVDAARRNRVVVQHGTQSRSMPLITGAVQMLRDGVIGDVLVAKAWNIQSRRDIGHHQPTDPPPNVDYDTWVGPAAYLPYQSNRFHYDWHWWHNFGTGDIGNDGTHEIDYARWGLGVQGLPTTTMASGGKYFFDDDQQFPDTATCAFEWPGDGKPGSQRHLIFEMRLWSKNYPFNCDSGTEFYGTAGRMLLSKRGKLEIYDDRNKRIENESPKQAGNGIRNHQVDFLDAIRAGRKPSADVAEGHDSVALVHLANIGLRLGRSLQVDPGPEQVVGDPEANKMLAGTYRQDGHWAVPKGARS